MGEGQRAGREGHPANSEDDAENHDTSIGDHDTVVLGDQGPARGTSRAIITGGGEEGIDLIRHN